MPSWPLVLSPQHFTPPPTTSTHEWEVPKAMAVAKMPEYVQDDNHWHYKATCDAYDMLPVWLINITLTNITNSLN